MKSTADGRHHIVVFERGEEIIASLTEWCKKEGVAAATFNAVGAVERAAIGYYDLATKEYFFRNEPGAFEVASLTGNVSLVGDTPFIHAHAVLSRCDESCSTIGGHLQEAYVHATLEVFLIAFDMNLERKLDEAIGLKLITL